MRFTIVFIFLFVSCSIVTGQNLIGYKGDEIRKFMKENRKDMNFEKVTNNKFQYLKYSDNSGSQTLLFFLKTDSVCNSIRMICDEPTKAEKIKEFNAKYKSGGVNKWIDTRAGKDYTIRVEEEPWSSIITIEPAK
jgi:hypothetical protein